MTGRNSGHSGQLFSGHHHLGQLRPNDQPTCVSGCVHKFLSAISNILRHLVPQQKYCSSSEEQQAWFVQRRLSDEEAGVCARLKIARERVGLTQSACSKMLGLPAGSLTNYEYKKAPVRILFGLKFCHHLVINERWLATGEEPMEPCVGLFAYWPRLVKVSERDTFRAVFVDKLATLHDDLGAGTPSSLISSLLSETHYNLWRSERIVGVTLSHFVEALLAWDYEASPSTPLARKIFNDARPEHWDKTSRKFELLFETVVRSMDSFFRQQARIQSPPFIPRSSKPGKVTRPSH